jgi:O-antigen/teichoic acid export membrane protein
VIESEPPFALGSSAAGGHLFMTNDAGNSTSQLSLTRNFMWTFAGNAVYALCQWAAVVCLAKLGSAEMVGEFALALAIAFPITFIANLQLRVLFVTDHSTLYPFGQILGLRFVLGMVAVCALVATCKIAGYSRNIALLILMVAAAQLTDCLSENYYGISQRYERMDRIARSQILRSLLSVVFLAIAVHYWGNLLLAAAGLVLGRALILFGYDAAKSTFALSAAVPTLAAGDDTRATAIRFVDRIRPSWDLRNQLRMAWIALPLGTASMLISLNANMPRFFIQHFFGSRDVGIYSALSYIPTGCILTATALGQAVFARLSRYYAFGQNRSFNLLMIKAACCCGAVGVTMLLVSAIAGHRMLMMLYRPEYAEHTSLLLWLGAGATVGCMAVSLGCTMTATLHFKEQVPLLLVVLLSSFVACLFLIPRFGLLGGALAALVSMTTQLFGSAFVICYAIRNRSKQPSCSLPAGLRPAFETDPEG